MSQQADTRLEGLAARLQSIQEMEREKKDVLGKYEITQKYAFNSPI
jgi:hypothetical protein